MTTPYAKRQVISRARYWRWRKRQRAKQLAHTTPMSYADALSHVGLHGEAVSVLNREIWEERNRIPLSMHYRSILR